MRKTVRTPAKVNFHLGVHHEVDERGYHRVDSLMAPIDLWDTVTVEESEQLSVSVTPALEVAPEKTTVWRAVTLLAHELGFSPNVSVTVQAEIPERAGLGGSSADAGATMRCLCAMWGVDPLDPAVVKVARQVGADVPFFLDPRPSLFLGAGDERVEVLRWREIPLLLAMPKERGITSEEAYVDFDKRGTNPLPYENIVLAWESSMRGDVVGLLYNNLAPIACRLSPGALKVRSWMRERRGVWDAEITGSGSATIGICESLSYADRAADMMRHRNWRAWGTYTLCEVPEVC